jgi:hypothetical protein
MCKEKPFNRQDQKYPNLPDHEFIPLVYPGVKDIYEINKLQEVRNKNTKKLLTQFLVGGYVNVSLYLSNNKNRTFKIHVLMANIFYNNSEPEKYNIINHIDHNPSNNDLSNLEWVTIKENNSPERRSSINEKYLNTYIAMDDLGNELFTINSRNSKGYNLKMITSAISRNSRYHGYFWKSIDSQGKKKFYKVIGFSGNIDDYEWHEHWKYSWMSICKEGFAKSNKTNKLLGFINSSGYVKVSKYYLHRVIMEYILKRNLKKEEEVDHINTITYDNSFSNLKLTNHSENMRNPNTQIKLSKPVILCNLLGNLITFYKSKVDAAVELGRNSSTFYKSIIVRGKYIVIEVGDSETLYKKMENIIYKFSKDKSKILGVYLFINSIGFNKKTTNKYLNSGKPAPDGCYYMRGPEAVELVLSLGHGTAGNFKLEEKEESQKP